MELDQEGIWRKSILDHSRMQSPGIGHMLGQCEDQQGLNDEGWR